jgi:sigma-B regulation protein RsbU (phosphoserine phosphatase)
MMKTGVKVKILKIIVLSAMFLALTIAAVSVGMYNNYKKMRLSSAQAEISKLSENILQSMKQLQNGAIAGAVIGELYFRQKSRNSEELDKTLKKYLFNDELSVGMGVWFETDAVNPFKEKTAFYYYVDKNTGEAIFDSATVMTEAKYYDYENSFWYKSIKEQIMEKPYDAVVWTQPYYDDSGSFELMVSAGSGIFDENGRFIGISTVDWLLSEIIEKITNIKPTPNTITLLADKIFDYIVALSYPSKSAKQYSGYSLDSLEWICEIFDGKTFVYNNIKYVPFVKNCSEKMLVAAIVPEKELFAEINSYSLRMLFFFVVAILFMVLLIYRFLDEFVSKPVLYLSNETKKIADGDFDIQISLNSKDEFGQLANSFNIMTDGIRRYISEIKKITEEKGRISAELDVAKRIQNSMMPNLFPAFPERRDFDIYAAIHPAKEVGGDFYDFFFIDDTRFAMVIADVSGKGVPAALFMVIAKTLIKNNISTHKNLSAAFTKTNAQLCENNDMGLFVTAFAAIVNIENGQCSFVNAGHNPVYIKRKDSQYERLKSQCGFVLAGLENIIYKEEETVFNFGDILFLYTDGVTEAMNEKEELFSDRRLKNVLDKYCDNKIDVKELIDGVYCEVKDFTGAAIQNDDMTMLAFLYDRRPASEKKIMFFEASTKKLHDVLDFIEKELSQIECPSKCIKQLIIAVEEIFVNIAFYAYSESEKKDNFVEIQLLLNEENKEIEITFIDGGKPYNPLLKSDPDTGLSADKRKIGGLGIYMSKKLSNMRYVFTDDKNILTLTKRWK